jgi:serine/threonine protein kinase
MLVMYKMDTNLRDYLQQNYNKLTWKERIKIAYDIVLTLDILHNENVIHRDLHSGNILYSQLNQKWYIGDFGFCGPVDKPQKSIYGNLPYIAPEVINGKGYTFESDIYGISMLMWEISSGKPPFINHDHDYNLALNIIYGLRPKIVPKTPLKYANLMKKCWDADSVKRPDINTLAGELIDMYKEYKDELPQPETKKIEKMTSSRMFTSKIYQFKNLPEPRNATEGKVITSN